MDSSVYPSKDVIKASKSAVFLFASKESDHGTAEFQVGREKETWCKPHFGIKCEDHVALFSACSQQFFDGQILMPTHVLCKPDGTEMKREVGAMAGKAFVEWIATATKELGPGLGSDEYVLMTGKVADGTAALEKGELKTAFKACDELKKNKAFKGMEARLKPVDELLGKINEAGLALIEKGKEAAGAGSVDEARKAFRQVISDCGTLECVKAAKTELAALPKDAK